MYMCVNPSPPFPEQKGVITLNLLIFLSEDLVFKT